MTAPTNPAPLPVVACVIGIAPTQKAKRHVIAAEYATEVRDGDLPALAVSLALFEDEGFIDAILARMAPDDWACACQDEKEDWLLRLRVDLDAIAAELRERAEKGAGDA
jgi:hypothetical protein